MCQQSLLSYPQIRTFCHGHLKIGPRSRGEEHSKTQDITHIESKNRGGPATQHKLAVRLDLGPLLTASTTTLVSTSILSLPTIFISLPIETSLFSIRCRLKKSVRQDPNNVFKCQSRDLAGQIEGHRLEHSARLSHAWPQATLRTLRMRKHMESRTRDQLPNILRPSVPDRLFQGHRTPAIPFI